MKNISSFVKEYCKKCKKALFDDSLEIRIRVQNLFLIAMAIDSVLLYLLIGCYGKGFEWWRDAVVSLGGICLIMLIVTLNRMRIASAVTTIFITMLFVPYMYLRSGGYENGSCVWFFLLICFPGFSFHRKSRIIFYYLSFVSMVQCFVMENHNAFGEIADIYSLPSECHIYVCVSFFIILMIICCFSMKTYDHLSAQYQKNNEEKERALKSAEESCLAKCSFLDRMSHEIRTPLNVVLGMNERILKESENDNITSYSKTIENAGRDLLALAGNFLDLSKMESKEFVIKETAYLLEYAVSDCINTVRMKAEEKGLSIEAHVCSGIPSILLGDSVRIKRILSNLLENAVKYTDKGIVKINIDFMKINADRIRLIIAVTDNEKGIPKDELKNIMNGDIRNDVSDMNNGRIELAVVKMLVKLMGGTLTAESITGVGSSITVNIPQKVRSWLLTVGKFSDAAIRRDIEKNRQLLKTYGAEILVVDDVKMNIRVVRALLKDSGVTVDEADGGKKCLSMIRKKRYDVIFLDYMMPGMNGIETLHAMDRLQDSLNKDTPVIALTANTVAGAREIYLSEGFSDYLAKPAKGEELEDMIIKHLARGRLLQEYSPDTRSCV